MAIAPAHHVLFIIQFQAEMRIPMLDHFLLTRFKCVGLFPVCKGKICIERNQYFKIVEEIKEKTVVLLKRLTHDNLQWRFRQWKLCVRWCIDKGEVYVEVDSN